jgi:uncharacterized repeat protein (TIGR03843 family)
VTTEHDRIERLRRAPLEVLGRFAGASNATLLCRLGPLDVDDDADALAVYKPRRGERPLWDFPRGSLHVREIAAFLVDRALGFGMVPETVLRTDAPLGEGSVQRFVEHDPERHYFALTTEQDVAIREQLEAMIVFDLIVNNADRKAGHVLVEADTDVRLVDHGVCFHTEEKLRTVAWDLAGEPIRASLRATAADLARRLERDGDPLCVDLAQLLDPAEVVALGSRAARTADLERFPPPSGPRPWPWPPI